VNHPIGHSSAVPELEAARRIAEAAARRHGVRAPVVPLRPGGANAVFRAGDVVVRVAPASADVAGQVALAQWLVAERFPVPAPLGGPDELHGALVSLWEDVSADPARPVD
jgi:hypothetical protein